MLGKTYNNYWKMDLKEIPSMGKLYPKGTIIKIRPLNVQEIKYLATITPDNATDIINEILEKCLILKNLDFEDIFLGDREYFVFWLRINSFTRNSGYDVTINECEKCKNPYNINIKLTDFEERYMEFEEQSVLLPDSEITLKLKYPRIKDLEIKNDDKEIETFIRYLDLDDNMDMDIVETFIQGLSAFDYVILKNRIEQMYLGFDRNITIFCPICNHAHTYNMEISDYGLFGSVQLYEVLEMILRISKSMNYQISDNMPWMEVEVLQEAANKINEEEQKQYEKEQGKITMTNPTFPKIK